MILPLETQTKIKADAIAYVEKTRGQEGRVETYIAGATECAGRASGLVDTLERLDAYIVNCMNYLTAPDHGIIRSEIITALAKYKEVTNG
jgi:hypothetical protein